MPSLNACLDRTFVSRAWGAGIPRDGFLGMVGLWVAEHFRGVKQGVLAAKPEELILGIYNTPFSFSIGCQENLQRERRGKSSLLSCRAAVQ